MTVALGFQGPLSGPFSWLGNGLVCAIELALPPDGSIRLETADSAGSPQQASEAARSLSGNKNVVAIVGPTFSRETEASAPELDEVGVPFVLVVATKPELGMAGWSHFFRLVATDDVRGPAVADLLLDTLGAKRPGLLYEETETGTRVAAHVRDALSKRHGLEIGHRTFSRGECDEADVLALLDVDADAVFFVGEYGDAATAAISLRDNGARIPLLTDDGARSATFIERAGRSAEGTIAVVPTAPLPLTAGFEQEFGARCGSPVVFATEAFQAASLLVSLITEVGADRAAVTSALHRFDGDIAGRKLAFTSTGENRYPYFYAYRVSDGAWVPWRELPGQFHHVSNLSAKESR